MKKSGQLLDNLLRAATWLAGLVLIFLGFLVCASAVSRYAFSHPFLFTDEISSYSLLLIAVLPLGYALKAGDHVRVDLLLGRFSGKRRQIMELAARLLAVPFGVLLLLAGMKLVQDYLKQGTVAPTELRTPLFIFALFIPVGCLLMLIELARELLFPHPEDGDKK